VVAWVRGFLDEIFPLAQGSHRDARAYRVVGGRLVIELTAGTTGLARPETLTGYTGSADDPDSLLLTNHGLGVILEVDRDHPVGKADAAGIKDVVIESAVTTIVDFEDSVTAVDA